MPLRNRVTPWGEIVAVSARGAMMGNRGGAIHNESHEIVRPYASRRWIACVLEFKGRHRIVMSPNRYTELFFLDEAVALAAGHRPCAECRRERFNAFKAAWARAHDIPISDRVFADPIDLELHPARIDRQRGKVTYHAPLESLPDGSFIRMTNDSYLVCGDFIYRWTFAGYQEKRRRPNDATVEILTPEPIVRCLLHGYRPQVHPSLAAL